MPGPRRLLILINSLAAGGAENFVLNQLRYTDRARFEPSVCQIGGSDTLRPAIEALGVEVFNLRERRRPDPRSLARLAVLLGRRRPQILQAHNPYAVIAARLVGRLARVKAVVTTEQGMHYQYQPRTRNALDLTLGLSHVNVFISRACFDATAKQHPELRRSEPTIIPNGIDARAIAVAADGSRAAVRAELGIGSDDLAFANVARLVPVKGQRYVIDAFAQTLARVPTARLFLCGIGPLREELERQADAVGARGRVHFLGERTDIPRLLGGFDAYVHPATTEALGIAVLEAMSAGLPTIGAATDALPEFIEPERTGWLVPPRDIAALVDRMVWIAHHRAEAATIGRRARETITRAYDIQASVRAYEALYDRLSGSY